MLALIEVAPQWGFWRCRDRLRVWGHAGNWKRISRVYRALGLNLKRRGKKRLPTRPRVPVAAPAILNTTWARDFMGDTRYDGRCYRTLNVLDERNREGLAISGTPGRLRCESGPEFIAEKLAR